jgi:RNA polymerase sigma factor (sigma-70 family)
MVQHERLVHAVIHREGSGDLAYAEALHAGRIGLWRALLGYDPQRGTAFSTYAWVAIRRHVRHRAQEVGRAAQGPPDAWEPEPWDSADLTDPALLFEEQLIRQELLDLVDQLPEPLRTVIVRRYGLGTGPAETPQTLGADLGVSGEWIRQLQLTALAWLRHPAHSVRLREVMGWNTRAAYRQALAQNAALRRARRSS